MKDIKTEGYYLLMIIIFFILTIILSIFNVTGRNSVMIYLKDKNRDKLVAKKIVIPKSKSIDEKAKWILRELISGPIGNRYERIVDPGIEIKNVIFSGDIVYINFDWAFVDSLYKNPYLVLNSIAKSIFLNIGQIEGVKILIDGIEPVNTFCNVSLTKTFKNHFY